MIVHVIGSLREFKDDTTYILKIIDTLKAQGSHIALDWISSAVGRRQRGQTPVENYFDWAEIVESNVNAISGCDALIVEGSRFNYSQGFQTALALEHGKPVLNLYREDLPEYKEWPDKLFVSGIANPLFTSRAYKTEDDLQKIVTEFLDQHAKKLHELDMKLALDAESFNKITRISQDEGKSQTSVIKDMIMKGLNTN